MDLATIVTSRHRRNKVSRYLGPGRRFFPLPHVNQWAPHVFPGAHLLHWRADRLFSCAVVANARADVASALVDDASLPAD